MTDFKICIIGAGSVGFTKKLCSDILKVPEFENIEITLTDINGHNLDMIAKIIRRIVGVNGLKTKVTATTDRRAALEGARYIMNCVRIGGLEAFADDIRIPLKYGVDQCVGDTICAGGIMYGQRGISAILEFCKDIREVAETNALLLNYANPMAMMTWAAIDHGKVNTVGCATACRTATVKSRAPLASAIPARLISSALGSTTRHGISTSVTMVGQSGLTNWSRRWKRIRFSPNRKKSASMC